MDKVQAFPCPNCGSCGTRRHFVSQDVIYRSCPDRQVTTTECSICDYRMTMCSLNGKVIETSSFPFATATHQSQVLPVNLEISRAKQKIIAFKDKISA